MHVRARIVLDVCVCGAGINAYVQTYMNPKSSHMQIHSCIHIKHIQHMLYQLHIIQLCFTQIAF